MEVTEPSKRLGQIGEFVPVCSGTFAWPVKSCVSEEEVEELRMKEQARLAGWLQSATARRLLGGGQSGTAVVGTRVRRKEKDSALELQMHDEHRVIKLTDVAILPEAGEAVPGTLEAHVNGFIYRASSFHMVFMHANIVMYFMRFRDMMRPPLLQFRLQHPVMVGTKETKDILFYLVPTPLGQVGSDKDSDNSEKEHTRNSSRNEDLKKFVHQVQQEPQSWGSVLPICFDLLEEFKFYGEFSTGASATFALTYSALVVLEETPLVVVPLFDIQIVNLAQLGPETLTMTVVFNDFKLLEISSISSKFLLGIKHRLNFGCVKYYVNSKKLNWNKLVKDIRESPKNFIDSGGWGSSKLELEDRRTLTYYRNSDSDFQEYNRMICF